MKQALAQAEQVFAKLEVGGKTELMVMLSRSGAVNRAGGMDDDHNPFCMGTTEALLFAELIADFPEDLLELAGRYTFPNPQGSLCVLTLTIEGQDWDTGFEFTYGEDSEGPPEEIVAIVEQMLDLTDEWYDAQRQQKKRN